MKECVRMCVLGNREGEGDEERGVRVFPYLLFFRLHEEPPTKTGTFLFK